MNDSSKTYQQGLEDAWECAKKIGQMNQITLEKMGFDFCNMKAEEGWNPSWWIINNYLPEECISKINQ